MSSEDGSGSPDSGSETANAIGESFAIPEDEHPGLTYTDEWEINLAENEDVRIGVVRIADQVFNARKHGNGLVAASVVEKQGQERQDPVTQMVASRTLNAGEDPSPPLNAEASENCTESPPGVSSHDQESGAGTLVRRATWESGNDPPPTHSFSTSGFAGRIDYLNDGEVPAQSTSNPPVLARASETNSRPRKDGIERARRGQSATKKGTRKGSHYARARESTFTLEQRRAEDSDGTVSTTTTIVHTRRDLMSLSHHRSPSYEPAEGNERPNDRHRLAANEYRPFNREFSVVQGPSDPEVSLSAMIISKCFGSQFPGPGVDIRSRNAPRLVARGAPNAAHTPDLITRLKEAPMLPRVIAALLDIYKTVSPTDPTVVDIRPGIVWPGEDGANPFMYEDYSWLYAKDPRARARIKLWKVEKIKNTQPWSHYQAMLRCLMRGVAFQIFLLQKSFHIIESAKPLADRPIPGPLMTMLSINQPSPSVTWREQVRAIMRSRRGEALLREGGLVWRIALEFSNRAVINSALRDISSIELETETKHWAGEIYLSQNAASNDIEVLLGATREGPSLWPPLDLFLGSLRWSGEWSDDNESFFKDRMQQLRSGQRYFITRSDWRTYCEDYQLPPEDVPSKPVYASQAYEAIGILDAFLETKLGYQFEENVCW